MNEFTKEELEELLDGIGWKLGEGQADKLTLPLEGKLKLMIDNYCEHKVFEGAITAFKCMGCGILCNDN